eukprot:CAMPEP_0170733098 /NCGR_PEP_ID=MMETSP0437-20130122/1899_1 /TAXON_ID=0 /ORGANISM="Sexangularia sp." /LENGTH=152 /DNA_ID=CAMNT_0011071369 /DNA_START=163 /DNA_END=616 /DNA_ORIENTATION=+
MMVNEWLHGTFQVSSGPRGPGTTSPVPLVQLAPRPPPVAKPSRSPSLSPRLGGTTGPNGQVGDEGTAGAVDASTVRETVDDERNTSSVADEETTADVHPAVAAVPDAAVESDLESVDLDGDSLFEQLRWMGDELARMLSTTEPTNVASEPQS